MAGYAKGEGIIVGRRPDLDGNLLVRFVTPEGSLEAKARKGVRPTGRSGRLSLFHHVRFQVYAKGQGLPTLTEVELVGRLFGLEEPKRFFLASFLGELAYRLASPDVAPRIYPLLVSGLRGIAKHPDPRIPLVWAGWRAVRAGGLAPSLSGPGERLAGGRLGGQGVYLGPEGVEALKGVLALPGKEAVELLEKEGEAVGRLLDALRFHVKETLGDLSVLTIGL